MPNSSRSSEARPAWFWPIVATVAIVAVAGSWLIIPEQRASHHAGTCYDNLRQVALAIRQYSMDNDERYPPVRISKVADSAQPWGWADAIAPYAGGTKYFQCPRDASRAQNDASQSGYIDYWYNGNMATKPEEKVAFLPSTVLLGEGGDGIDVTSARYNKKAMPPQWLTDTSKPSFRHASGANYAFVDGHVQWCVPKAVAPPAPTYNTYSLALR